jgi:O-antigen ligase
MVVAALASSLIAVLQVFAPDWGNGDWIARSSIAGRAVGNMRQSNHLSSLLLWGIIAVVWLGEARVLRKGVDTALALLFIFAVVLSSSRTGAAGMLMLAVWGVLDRRLSKRSRALLLLAPVIYAVFWFGASAWADQTHQVFGGETRFSTKGDISSSRYGIWSNTLSLIKVHPWFGVGFGEFNFAWTLTPFPGRPVAFFDHTHNLPLQFAVELGLPLAVLATAGLCWALLRALMLALQARASSDPGQAPMRRAAFMMVFMVCVHSLLEYPLWYAYFLLPAAFAFGLCLGRPAVAVAEAPASAAAVVTAPPARSEATRPMLIAAMLLMIGGLASVVDYMSVVVIFAPPDNAAPLAQRIEVGRRSWFFAHHADYAAATTTDHPAEALASFKTATHYLLDSRLMMAWAKALNDAGDTDRARYVAQRLREFRNDAAAAFFEPCTEPAQPGVTPPFQCLEPQRPLRYEDFR